MPKFNELLEGGHPETEEEYKDVKEMLFDFAELAKILQKQTKKRGSIDFETKEPTIILDDDGKPDRYLCQMIAALLKQMIE